jgi:hypothetical protein
MALALVQMVLAAAGALGLYRLWKSIDKYDPLFGLVSGVGLAGRAVAGVILFCLSWLRLAPRELHLGGGFWFFALDGWMYTNTAVKNVARGAAGFVPRLQDGAPPVYIDLLTLFTLLFGEVASVGLFLNLVLFTFACWIIARCSRGLPHARRAASFALAALALYPAGVVWSTQPLKDTMVHALLVALPAAALLWQRAWDRVPRRGVLTAAVVLCLTQVALTFARWYVGMAVLGGVLVFLAMFALARRGPALLHACTVALAIVSIVVVLVAASADLPTGIKRALAGASFDTFISSTMRGTDWVRRQFDRTGASTQFVFPEGTSRPARWLGGLVAATVPHFAIEWIDFPRIGGGRGFFWFADIDTMVFDAAIILSLILLWRGSERGRLWNGLAWLCPVVVVLLALPMLYAITNFGTLMRLRGMLYVPVVIAPLAQALGRKALLHEKAGSLAGEPARLHERKTTA